MLLIVFWKNWITSFAFPNLQRAWQPCPPYSDDQLNQSDPVGGIVFDERKNNVTNNLPGESRERRKAGHTEPHNFEYRSEPAHKQADLIN